MALCHSVLFQLLLFAVSGSFGQTIDRRACTYTFNVPVDEFEAQCVTSEIRQTLDEIRRENKKILSENVELRQQIKKIYEDYSDMIETVKSVQADTATWRQVVEWPVFDTPFQPENVSAIVDKTSTYVDCYQALKRKSRKKPGLYTLKAKDFQRPLLAYCDDQGWTVVMRRLDGQLEFDRNWSDYSGGFGELNGEHWLGLENMHLLTSSRDYELRVEAVGWNNKLYEGQWDYFQVGGELDKYPITVGNMTSGNYKDVLTNLNTVKFSTKDSDNDQWYQNSCAAHYNSGWWLTDCGFDPNRAWCNGNGCMTWGELNIKRIVLKIRPMIAKGVVFDAVSPTNVPRKVTKKPLKSGKKRKNSKKKKKKKKNNRNPKNKG